MAIMTISKFAFSDVTAFPTLPFWSIEYIYTAYWQSASEVPALISVCLPDSLCAYRVRYITSLTACVWCITYDTSHTVYCTVQYITYRVYGTSLMVQHIYKLLTHTTYHTSLPFTLTVQYCLLLYIIMSTHSIILLLHITYTQQLASIKLENI